jgi:hypothetical protein
MNTKILAGAGDAGKQLCLVAAVFLIAGNGALARAQTDAGALRVLVADTTGGVVPGADVTLTNVATNTALSRVSDQAGYATFSPIPRGTYHVEIQLSGFQTVRIRDVTVEVQQNRLVRATLQVADLAEAVEVTAQVAPLQTEEGSLGQVIRGEVAVELPLAGRRYTDLALLMPGATDGMLDETTRGPGWFTVSGLFHTQNNFILDGFDNNQGTTNMQSRSSQVVQPSPDAISEFKVQTNAFSAEFGRSAGAVVNVSLKSGGNTMHGSGWYYNRDDALAAKSWQTNLLNLAKDNLKWNQFGGTFGGPIVRNRLFYFSHYEGFNTNRTQTFLTTVPTADMKAGRFPYTVRDPVTGLQFPGNVIPQERLDPLAVKLANLYPAPNLAGRIAAGGRPVDNYGVGRPEDEETHKFDVRNDYYVSQRDRLFVRYSYMTQDIFREAILPAPADDGAGARGAQINNAQSLGLSWSRTIGSSTVNEARFGYNRTYAAFDHATIGGVNGRDFGFRIPAELDAVGGLPMIGISNFQSMGTGGFRPQYQQPQAWQFLNVLTMLRGAHAVSTGFEFRHKHNEFVDTNRVVPAYNFNGRWTGDGMADMLLGWPNTISLANVAVIHQLQQATSAFVQDDWKLSPNFTLNLGLRYEYTTPYWGKEPFPNVNFDLTTGQLVRATSDEKYLVTRDMNNFGPRLGFAYVLKPDRFVLRGGYGIFYGGEEFRGSTGNLPLNPPNVIRATIESAGQTRPPVMLSDPVPGSLVTEWNPVNSITTSLFARAHEEKAATIHQWNIAHEFLLPIDATIEVAYVGNRGHNFLGAHAANQTPFGIDGSIARNRPYPAWAGVSVLASVADTAYDGLQLKFERRMRAGWYNLTSYAYGRAYGETGAFGADSSPQLYDNWDAEWGPDSRTPRHRLSIANIYQFPIGRGRALGSNMSPVADFLVGGWQVSAIYTWRTGLPVSVTMATTGVDPLTGQAYTFLPRNGGGQRPDIVGNPQTGVDPSEDRFNFLALNAYRVPALNTAGNAPRNSAWGPGFTNLDISLVKRFRVNGSKSFDFRVEAFNAFNSTRWQSPSGSFGSANFGIINDAFPPRVVQMALRFAF